MRGATVPSENDVARLALDILGAATPTFTQRVRDAWSIDQRLLRWAIARPAFKTQLFRFVDVFPACRDRADVLRHLDEYLSGPESPAIVRAGLHAAHAAPGGDALAGIAARAGIRRMAKQFIGGSSTADAVGEVGDLWSRGFAATVDLLGEKTLTLADADAYARRVREMLDALTDASRDWRPQPRLEQDPWGSLPRANVSVKASALAPLLGPQTLRRGVAQAIERLGPIVERAQAIGATVHVDTEHDELKDATFTVLREVVRAVARPPQLGCVVQAYRTDAYDDLTGLVKWSAATLDRPLQVRLVKGAYWDAETIVARAHGWVPPVWPEKDATDASYERCAAFLVEHAGDVRPAFASHNARSLAFAIASTRTAGLPDDAIECQVLYGMATPLHDALRELGLRTRVYVPVGELVPGMSYLVRRLLENTSNESFVRHRYTERRNERELIAAPKPSTTRNVERVRPYVTDVHSPGPFTNEPAVEIRRPTEQDRFSAALDRVETTLGFDVPLIVDGGERSTDDHLRSVDPGDYATVVCDSASATVTDVEDAVAVARDAWPAWAATGWDERAATLFRAAAAMRKQRDDLAALIVFEAGKPVVEADADVCEAIDFLEYYGREALALEDGAPVLQVPGEANRYGYQPRGIGVVIAPWNFPLAIPTGMVSAALVTGNAVLFKPAEQTPGIALRLARILLDAGVPPGVFAFLPGVGETIGPPMVEHPDVSFITFTGSRAVGLEIVRRAADTETAARQVKRVVAEMGGKNAIVVDSDADLDEAVPAIVQSGFSYAGQKCSAAARIIAVGAVHDSLVERLAGAAQLVPIGHPRNVETVVGPLIDEDAYRRVLGYQQLAARDGRVVVQRQDVPDGGWYVGPTVVVLADTSSPVANDEIFGPVLAVFQARDFDHAIALANDTPYALTSGCFSRSPAHLEHAARELRAGNVYLNRGITGAMVGRQPFGGYGLSGVGSKAGGPDYLHQFVDPRAIAENTMRQGFAPD